MQNLQTYLSGRTSLSESRVEVGGKSYCLAHPDSAEALIDEEDFDLDERLPYWATIWPSAVALARYLSARNLSDKKTIELGCGVGLPAVVALDRGAEVTATDHYEIALDFARQNAKFNTGLELNTAHLDWHSPHEENLERFDLVLAADVLYEERNLPALATLIPGLLATDGEALISTPCRRDTPDFREMMTANGFTCATQVETARQGERDIEVLIQSFRRAS
ncbi:MAG: methyltransferase domain-containing protein [Rubrobacteraceae bacterium]